MIEQVLVPDVGEAEGVEVVEILVAVGDIVGVEDSIVVLESDKASMELPSPGAGMVKAIHVSVGDNVEEGSLLMEIEATDQGAEASTLVEAPKAVEPEPEPEPAVPEPESTRLPAEDKPAGEMIETSHVVPVPDVGDAAEVIVVEILVQRGDNVTQGDSILVLESDKASMEIPADMDGLVQEIFVHEGDTVTEGDPLITLLGKVASEVADSTAQLVAAEAQVAEPSSGPATPVVRSESPAEYRVERSARSGNRVVYAGPAVRKEARELGVDLADVRGSGRKGRILKEDMQEYVKARLSGKRADSSGTGVPPIPEIDFSKWGEIEEKPLSRIRKASAKNLHRSWLNVPHVTQFDEADITELETFRKEQNAELAAEGKKITPLAFLVRAVVDALQKYPQFNSSLGPEYEHLVLKKYYNIGIAVETEDGLVVPVVKAADTKGVVELAGECAALAAKAREGKLPMDAMQGATFTISSLGGIGGTAFTPIVNAPEVAILGVSKSKVAPVFDGEVFVPRTILPLSLSYDHRAIDGAEAARFTTYLSKVLSDIRRIIL